MRLALVALACMASCGECERDEIDPPVPPTQVRRVIEPPSDNVRPLPPYAIRADGVGPYVLGAELDSVLAKLPTGPRIAQFDIPGVVRASVLRADDTIIIGGEPRGRVGFIAVTSGDVARTEAGSVHVGSSRDELVHALGPIDDDPDHARDPHLVAVTGLPDLRAIVQGDAVVALAIRNDLEPPRKAAAPVDGPAPATDCTRPVPRDAASGEPTFGACLATGELVTVDGDDLAVRTADGDHPIVTVHVPNLSWAGALRDGDRDDLVAISRSTDDTTRTWSLVAYRADGSKLVRVVEATPLYTLTESSARWIGAELGQIELCLELVNRGDTIEAGGLLVTKDRHVRDVVAVSPISVARKRGKPAQQEGSNGGGTPDHGGRTPLPSQ
jgi:hypothetical protein|nr:hypothetical protein [Kofleriaceae bacterium]